jgi:hypothetical protein
MFLAQIPFPRTTLSTMPPTQPKVQETRLRRLLLVPKTKLVASSVALQTKPAAWASPQKMPQKDLPKQLVTPPTKLKARHLNSLVPMQ